MALARIITRSHSCSRELALDLIARGYAVEIVSPDSIPDNLADLELRVEEDHGNQLVASVPAHNGDLTASLEFVHHLEAPMAEFIRRLPEPHEALQSPEKPVRFNADQNGEVVEPPADAPQLAPETVSPAAEILQNSSLHSIAMTARVRSCCRINRHRHRWNHQAMLRQWSQRWPGQ
jgi:hypothetical protein